MRMSAQHMSRHTADTGRAMANQASQLGGEPSIDMRSMANTFCGELRGGGEGEGERGGGALGAVHGHALNGKHVLGRAERRRGRGGGERGY